MKKITLLICTFIGFSIWGLEVDIVSNFAVHELPAQFHNVKKEFKVNLTRPISYLEKSADNPDLKKIIVFNKVYGDEVNIIRGLPKEKLAVFIWEPPFGNFPAPAS